MWYESRHPPRPESHLDPTGSESATTLSVMVEQPDIDPIACAQNGLTVDFTAEPGTLYWIRLQRGWQGQYGLVLRASEADLDTGVAAFFEPLSETTFYPYRDRYKDSVAIRGVRNEKAWVAVAIYKLNGRTGPRPVGRGGPRRLLDRLEWSHGNRKTGGLGNVQDQADRHRPVGGMRSLSSSW